ncbi:MAG TPA: hypothetical protein PLI27_08600 [Ignavibacteriales bacterium]|nr:hypothetical protein [Ignavibacteriales bacterium]HOL81191.1 hypothetical protein [Ignavibacteriales bacterium]HOM65294.1 hypothetical protein [Ignavibacteriales bacterium]HPD68118.1 hypothetical protein [Ignavibacteriales bacterium]HPP33453.1 hypothetical protein [Ignavibacteriales bacterium]
MQENRIKDLIRFFWKFGFQPIEIRGSKYLNTPKNIGDYQIDIVAKRNDTYAIGIIVNDNEFENQNNLIKKISFLASLKNKYNSKDIYLFLGCSKDNFENLKRLLNFVTQKYIHKIKVFYL